MSSYVNISVLFVSGSESGVVLISSIVEKRPEDHIGLFFQTITFK